MIKGQGAQSLLCLALSARKKNGKFRMLNEKFEKTRNGMASQALHSNFNKSRIMAGCAAENDRVT